MAGETILFYHKQFSQVKEYNEFSLLDHVPTMTTVDTNDQLCMGPDMRKIKKVVFKLNGSNTSGPNGLPGQFYQTCCDIVGEDVVKVVQAFFQGHTLPRTITHTNLVLLPKKENTDTFADLRPISLSNFINKVIFRVIHGRLEGLLSQIISPNQTGFVKGRSII